MPARPLHRILDNLRKWAILRDGGISDGDLLGAFLANNDEIAFEALMRRHGPMVLGVCRRLLCNVPDAEDAFQATFLVLVRRAASVVPREAVGNWLYGVAFRTAIAARRTIRQRHALEKQLRELPQPQTDAAEPWQEWYPLLDQEVSGLPDKYRLPVVLCDLQGRTRREVASLLKIPHGTLSNRLAAARKLLARRLARHGIAPSIGLLAGKILSQNTASAWVPATLLGNTVKAAPLFAAGNAVGTAVVSAEVAALTQGVLKAMFFVKLKIFTVTSLLLGLVAAAGGLVYTSGAGALSQNGQEVRIENKKAPGDADQARAAVQDPDNAKVTSFRGTGQEFRRLDQLAEAEAALEKAKAQLAAAEAAIAEAKARYHALQPQMEGSKGVAAHGRPENPVRAIPQEPTPEVPPERDQDTKPTLLQPSITAHPGEPERRYVASRQFTLNFELIDVHPSEVAEAEIWCTDDESNTLRTYFKLAGGSDPNQKSVNLAVPRDGLYGLSVIVRNKNGHGDKQPKPGDRPQIWVEVDTTSPIVRFQKITGGEGKDKGKVTITWTAHDKNLTADPISLCFATKPLGPWHLFAVVPNTGSYEWTLPPDMPARFHLAIRAIDRAGNVSKVTTEVMTEPSSPPRGRITSVESLQPNRK